MSEKYPTMSCELTGAMELLLMRFRFTCHPTLQMVSLYAELTAGSTPDERNFVNSKQVRRSEPSLMCL